MEKVFSITRKTYDRKPTDDLKDPDVNTAVWGIFMSVTLQAAVHLGQDYSQNLRSIKSQILKSVEPLFRTPEKLIKDQVEITGLFTVDWNQPVWRESPPLCDGAVRIMKSQTYVFADSVLCLRGISTVPVRVWKDKIKWNLETRYLKDVDRIDGEPMEFEWTNFPGFTTLRILDEIQKDDGGIRVWTWATQRKDHLHVNVQWHCMEKTRKQRKVYGEFHECCSICQEVPARMLVICGIWLCEKVERNSCQQAKWWMEQNCWSHDAQLCWEEENSKAKVVERCPFTTTEVKKPLNWFFARLFLSISTASTEQSQSCAKNKIQIQGRKLKVRFVNLWWHRMRFPMLTPHLRVQHHWHRWTYCKNTNGNSQNFLKIRRWFLTGNWERTILHYNYKVIWGYADSMSRIHTTSKSENIPTERVDSFEYENRPSLGCENLSSRRTLLYWYHDWILV